MYLTNTDRLPGAQLPYPQSGLPNFTIVYADGKPVRIGNGGTVAQITIGVGANREQAQVNYVNEDGSINVSFAGLVPAFIHAPGEVVMNSVLGNPGPVGSLTNPGPFDPLRNANSPYRGVVPYVVRVR